MSETSGKHPSTKRYPPEMRERAVRMVAEAIAENGGDRFGVIPRIAHRLEVGTVSMRGWVNQAEVDGGVRPGTSTDDKARIAELEREVRELRRANDMAGSGGGRTICV